MFTVLVPYNMCSVIFAICNLFVDFDSPEMHFFPPMKNTKRAFIQENMLGI